MSEEKEVITHHNCDLCDSSIDNFSEKYNRFFTPAYNRVIDICPECIEVLKKWVRKK